VAELDTIPLASLHHGVRFELRSEKDAMTLLLMLVRDGKVTVSEALECFKFDTGVKHGG
jgi:hypothetical protein